MAEQMSIASTRTVAALEAVAGLAALDPGLDVLAQATSAPDESTKARTW